MKVQITLLLAALAVGALAQDDPTGKLSGVHDLTPDDFDAVVNGRKAALIEFYAPWCGHCKRIVPEYKRLGEKVASDPKLASRVVIAKVNADEHRSLGERFGVRGFPTLKWFPRGKPKAPEDYNGGRSLDDFLRFIDERLRSDAGFARVAALVPLARQFVAVEDKVEVLKHAEEVAAGLAAEDADNGALYLRYMRKGLDKGVDWLTTELARLEKLVEKGASAAKLEEISRKISVLSSFLEEPEDEPAHSHPHSDENDDDDDDDDDEEDIAQPHAAAEVDADAVHEDAIEFEGQEVEVDAEEMGELLDLDEE